MLTASFFSQHRIFLKRFFSSAGYAYDELRQNILPAKLEQQLFLKFNKKFWDLTLVNDLVNLSE